MIAIMKNHILAHNHHPLLEVPVIHVRHLHPQQSPPYQELVKIPQIPKVTLLAMAIMAPVMPAPQIVDQVH